LERGAPFVQELSLEQLERKYFSLLLVEESAFLLDYRRALLLEKKFVEN